MLHKTNSLSLSWAASHKILRQNKSWLLLKATNVRGRVAPWNSAVVWVKTVESKHTLKVLQKPLLDPYCLVVGCRKGVEDDDKSFYGGGDSIGKMLTVKA